MNKHKSFSSISTIESFSSTTQLAKSELKPPVKQNVSVSITDGKSMEKSPYLPQDYRNLQHPTSTAGSLTHLLKGSLGSGILAMPNAFKNGGLLFGFAGTITVGFICTYCVHILVKTSQEICEFAKIPSLGFSETSEAAFAYGPKKTRKFSSIARSFVDIALVSTYFMGCCVYIVFISESMKQLIDYWIPNNEFDIYVNTMTVMVFLLVSIQVRELKHLVPFSFFANIFLVVSFGITLYYMFIDVPKIDERNMVFTDVENIPIFFSIVIFAMEGIGVVLPIENNMSNPQHFLGCPGVLNVSMSVVIFLYSVIGFFGYLKYGEETKASVTLNLPVDEIPAQVVKVFIILAVFLTCNLQVYAPLDIIWKKVVKKHATTTFKENLYQILMRVSFVVAATMIAIVIPDLEHIIGLVGSICLSILGVMIPAIVETAWRWEERLGPLKWILWKNILLGIIAVFALVSGTSVSIRGLLRSSDD